MESERRDSKKHCMGMNILWQDVKYNEHVSLGVYSKCHLVVCFYRSVPLLFSWKLMDTMPSANHVKKCFDASKWFSEFIDLRIGVGCAVRDDTYRMESEWLCDKKWPRQMKVLGDDSYRPRCVLLCKIADACKCVVACSIDNDVICGDTTIA